jgi:hypothetical protein
MAGGPTSSGLDYLAGLMTGGEQPVNSYFVALIPDYEPGFTSTGEDITEPEVDEYTRVEIINESGNWNVDGGSLSNMFEITFPTALTPWGNIRYWAVCDLEIEGRVFWVGEFAVPVYVDVGGVVTLDPGSVSLSFEGNQWKMGQ